MSTYKMSKEEAYAWDRCLNETPTDDDRITAEDVLLRANGATIVYPGCEPWRGARVEMVGDLWA